MIVTTTAQSHKELYNTLNSKTTSSPIVTASAKEVPTICFIKEDFLLPLPTYRTYAKVLQTFYLQLVPTDDGYVATSPISDICEQDVSAGDAVRKYLYSLADELLWLREQKENLSDAVHKQLDNIQSYMKIM